MPIRTALGSAQPWEIALSIALVVAGIVLLVWLGSHVYTGPLLRTGTFQVEESADNTAFTAVAAADLQGTEPVVDDATDDDQIYKLGYLGSKQYLRVAVTVSGATTGAVYGAMIIAGHPAAAPVS